MPEQTFLPGLVALFGSGETAPSGGAVYDLLARHLPTPPQIAVLETPAGFQPNSPRVAGRVADFILKRLQNERPTLHIVPARKRGTAYSPDCLDIARPLAQADMIFLGPGSPTYAVQQLQASLTWQLLCARHRLGAVVATASAATIAMSALALPVYEIYKVGADPHWLPGLNFFAPFGLTLVFVPHWNNSEGGAELDTSRCYIGQERWEEMLALLPPDVTVVGIDEHTALVFDMAAERCTVVGRGGVVLLRAGQTFQARHGDKFPIQEFGPFHLPEAQAGIPPAVWAQALPQCPAEESTVPPEVDALVAQRQAARERRDWSAADTLRRQIAALGWDVRDTRDGPVVERNA